MSANSSVQRRPQSYEQWVASLDRNESREYQFASLLAWGAEWKVWHLLSRREKRRLRQKERRRIKREIKRKQVQERLLQEQVDKFIVKMRQALIKPPG